MATSSHVNMTRLTFVCEGKINCQIIVDQISVKITLAKRKVIWLHSKILYGMMHLFVQCRELKVPIEHYTAYYIIVLGHSCIYGIISLVMFASESPLSKAAITVSLFTTTLNSAVHRTKYNVLHCTVVQCRGKHNTILCCVMP